MAVVVSPPQPQQPTQPTPPTKSAPGPPRRIRTATRPSLAIVAEESDESEAFSSRERAATTPQTRHEWEERCAQVGRPMTAPPYLRGQPAVVVKDRSLSVGVKGIRRRKSIKGRDRYLG